MIRGLRSRFSAAALRRSFSALQIVDYRRWSIAQFTSGAGGAAAQIAMAWLVVELGGDGVALGAVTACMMLPTLLLGSAMGMLIDRYSRRSVLLVTAVAQLLIAVGLAVLTVTGLVQLWTLLALSLLHGLAFAADNPARQLLVMDIVGRNQMTSAVSLNEVAINGARIIGPAVAGLLLVAGEPSWCFVFNAISFLPSIVVLLALNPVRSDVVATRSAPRSRPTGAGFGAVPPSGWRFVVGSRPIRSTLLLAACAAASFNIAVVMPLMVADVFHSGGGAYGALAMAFGLGALPGALFSATGPTTPRSTEIRMLAMTMGILVATAGFAPNLPLLFVCLAVVGAVVMWFIARANAFVMLETPAAIRGRVMGIWAMALPGSNVVTGLLVGGLADLAGPRIAYGSVGLVTAIISLACWRALRSPADRVSAGDQ